MALRALLLGSQIRGVEREIEALHARDAEFDARSAELEASIREMETAENIGEEARSAVETAVSEYETERAAHNSQISELESRLAELREQLQAVESEQPPAAAPETRETNNNSNMEVVSMEHRDFRNMSLIERRDFVGQEEVRSFLTNVRGLMGQNRAVNGAELLIPVTVLDLIRSETARESKLIPFVRYRRVAGEGRQTVMGTIPEAVWTEMCAKLNELDILFGQVTTDGYKVGAYIAICNAALQDSDIDLAGEIIFALGAAIAKAVDSAILFGTGTKMPLGIATRLAQTSQPADWGTNAPAWTDLHTSNVLSLNIDNLDGVEFFAALIAALGAADPKFSSDGLFWVMNRATHIKVLSKALAFNAAGAVVAGVNDVMPVIGGKIVEFSDDRLNDNCIIGGYGGNYLLAERNAATFGLSDQVFFIQDQTAFKGTARFDGRPVAGEAFVSVNFANSSAQTAHEFPEDYANADMNVLTLKAAAGTASGDTVVTVTNTLAVSNPDLAYKVRASVAKLQPGDDLPSGYESLTSGTTQITAAAGVQIAVVELDDAGKVVSAGTVVSVPRT